MIFSRRSFLSIAGALAVALGVSTSPAQAQQPVKIGMSMPQTGSLGAGGKAALLGAADVGRGRERQGRAARAQGRTHRLRRPDQPRPDAGHLHQAARHRQGRPADRAVRHRAHGADHAAGQAARPAADGQLLVPGEQQGAATTCGSTTLPGTTPRSWSDGFFKAGDRLRRKDHRDPRRRPGVRPEPGQRRQGDRQEQGPEDGLRAELPADDGRLLLHDPRHPRRQTRPGVRHVLSERLGRDRARGERDRRRPVR